MKKRSHRKHRGGGGRGKLLPACTPLPRPNHTPTTLRSIQLTRQINGNSIPGSLGIDIGTAPYLLPPARMHSAASSQPPSTIQQLLGAFSSPRQINANSIPGSPGIDIGTAPYCHRLLLRLNPLTPNNTTCPAAPMQSPPTNHITHYHHHAAPPIPRRVPRQAPYPILISPSFLAYSEYLPGDTYATRTRHINQIAITTGPRPTHGGYSPPALHQSANHPQTNISAYPRALKRGGRRRRTPPTTTTITDNTSTLPYSNH